MGGMAQRVYSEDDRYLGDEGFFYRRAYKYERINGVVYEMATPTASHGIISRNVAFSITAQLGRDCPCTVFTGNLALMYHNESKSPKKRGDYVLPDIMIVCESDKVDGGNYYGVPKFIAEVLSPSTKYFDKKGKLKIYEKLGVGEYWIIDTHGVLQIYYLRGGKYKMVEEVTLCSDKKSDNYNEEKVIKLREFDVEMALKEIFIQSNWGGLGYGN